MICGAGLGQESDYNIQYIVHLLARFIFPDSPSLLSLNTHTLIGCVSSLCIALPKILGAASSLRRRIAVTNLTSGRPLILPI